jgi:predicted ribosomally synthesized peptide with nif11-like leader
MTNLNHEMIEKAKAAKTAEELLELAKANGVEMTADEAKTYFAQLNPKSGELDDDDLDNVAGGACASTEQANNAQDAVSSMPCPRCGAVGEWALLHKFKDNTDFYCANCKLIVWTYAEENNSILHTNNEFYYPMTP